MIKEALEFLAKLQTPKNPITVEVGKETYAVDAGGTLGEPVRALAPQWTKPVFQVATLSGLAALVKAKVDEFPESVALHVVDHLNVELVALKADEYGRRHVYAKAVHVEGAAFKFNAFFEAEEFLISFRRSFLYNEDAVKLQQLCSNLESGMSVTLADDGVSQAIEAKSSTTSKAKVVLPAEGIPLIPWRTFRDAAPVASRFLLRLKGVKDALPIIALYEIDQVWKLDTVNSIATWLREHTEMYRSSRNDVQRGATSLRGIYDSGWQPRKISAAQSGAGDRRVNSPTDPGDVDRAELKWAARR